MQTFTISDLSFTYPTETAPALRNVSLSVEGALLPCSAADPAAASRRFCGN